MIRLTVKEQHILVLVTKGLRNKEIADIMFVSESTVVGHVSRIFDKLEVNNRVQAYRRALVEGLVLSPDEF
jgi:DNA-binding NarL/FixJ family response regulator